MPIRKTEKRTHRDENSEMLFLFEALRGHEEEIDRIVNKLNSIAETLFANIQKLNSNLKKINEKLSDLEEQVPHAQ